MMKTVSASRPLAPCIVSRRHRVGAHRRRALHRAALERADEAVRRGIAAAVEQQRLRQHGVDRIERERPLLGRDHRDGALAQLAFVDDAIEQVVRRQRRGRRRASRAAACAPARGPGSVVAIAASARHQSRSPAAMAAAEQGEQVVVAGAEQRAAQGPREREPMGRRDERVEHRDQILRLGRRGQSVVSSTAEWAIVLALQRRGDQAQRLALAAEHVKLGRRRARTPASARDRPRHRRRFLLAQHDLGLEPRRRQRVAPGRSRVRIRPSGPPIARRRAARPRRRSPRCRRDLAWCARGSRRTRPRSGLAEDAVDRGDHRGRVAPRVVAGEHAAPSRPRGRSPRAASKTRGSARAEAIDALLRVADDEDAGGSARSRRRRHRHTPTARRAARATAAGWCPGTRRSAGGGRACRAAPAPSRTSSSSRSSASAQRSRSAMSARPRARL